MRGPGVALNAVLHLLGRVLFATGLWRFVHRASARNPKVLLYHACSAREDDFIAGLDSNTPPEIFRRHLDFLQRHYTVVPLQSLAQDPPPHSVVITFDDGYRSVFDGAFPELAARRLPATVFLVGHVSEGRGWYWVSEVNWLLRRHGERARQAAARILGCRSGASIQELLAQARTAYEPHLIGDLLAALRSMGDLPTERLHLDAAELATMHAAGITFGNHTYSHPNLARLDDEQQHGELEQGLEAVSRTVACLPAVAYPFGHHNARSGRIAENTGHRFVLLVGGTNYPLDLSAIGRIPVSATSDAALFTEIELITPVRAALKRLLQGGDRGG